MHAPHRNPPGRCGPPLARWALALLLVPGPGAAATAAAHPAARRATPQDSEPDAKQPRRRGPDRPVRSVYPEAPEGLPPALAIADAEPGPDGALRPYVERIPGSEAALPMVPIPAGTFLMGSPATERGRGEDEGPRREVALEAFWMGATEVTWDAYHVFMFKRDQELRAQDPSVATEQDTWADAVSRPTPPYVPMDFQMSAGGTEGYPAICMTQHAARQFTKWLSMKTGRFYRLPTEAEWEYACRGGTTTAYWFGDDPRELEQHAWFYDNSGERYHRVGEKPANPWGLHDMHGNVAEWVLDRHDAGFYASHGEGRPVVAPLAWPDEPYPRVVRGGSWDDDPERLRSAARRGSHEGWKVQDPQMPKSIWYHTDARFVGFRLVRPLNPPPPDEWSRYWDADTEAVRKIDARQRAGGR